MKPDRDLNRRPPNAVDAIQQLRDRLTAMGTAAPGEIAADLSACHGLLDQLSSQVRATAPRAKASENAPEPADRLRAIGDGFPWTSREVTERSPSDEMLHRSNRLLTALRQGLADFILDASPKQAFHTLLGELLDLTESEFGFIGEVRYDDDGRPFLKTYAITDISWDETSRSLYEQYATTGFEFRNLDTLFGAVLKTGKPTIANDPPNDPRSGGLPPGHPPLRAFAGLPFRYGDDAVGMVGLANRPSGYDEEMVEFLRPLLTSCGVIIHARRGDERRNQVEAALRESEERFRQMAESVREVFWMSEPQSRRLLYVSPAFEVVFKRSCAQAQDRPEIWADAVHPEDRDTVEVARRRQLEGESTTSEYRIVRPDGSQRWIRDRAFPVRDVDGRVYRLTGIAEDITQRRRLEEQLLQSHKMEAIGTLAGGIAHEFNNILAAMLGYADLALFEAPEGTPTNEYIQHILLGGQRAKELVDQILTFSRRHAPARRHVRLDRQVAEVMSLIRATLPTTIEIRQSIAQDCRVLADPTQLHQIVMNLCTNAEHAMRADGGLLEVELEPVQVDALRALELPGLIAGPYARLRIRDSGHGIPADVIDRIRDPFFTTKTVGEGTGMGLSIVDGIVAGHGGAMFVESSPGEGSVFSIYLPRLEEPAPTHAATAAEPLQHHVGCVLFVDDEPALTKLGQAMLERLGFEVVTKLDGASALEVFHAAPRRFDLVITDQTMPGMTGTRLCERLREIRPDVPIILCTGFSHLIDAEQAKSIGIDGFCMKPYDVRELESVIRRTIPQLHNGAVQPAP